MSALGPPNLWPTALVDAENRGVRDPSTRSFVGVQRPFCGERLLWAAALNAGLGGVSKRYTPPHPATEQCNFGLDFSTVVPFGVGITSGSLSIFRNLADPTPADSEWGKGPIVVRGRAIYSLLTGGVPGTDYQLRWTATDSQGNIWPRTALCLCAETS